MYSTLRDVPHGLAEAGAASRPRRRRGAVGRVVLVLGLTSLLTDLSTEMVAAVLPLYLVLQAGLSPFQFGVVNGLNQAATAPVRLISGVLADRSARHREVAATGYAMSAVSRIGLLAAGGSPGLIGGAIAVDRLGKGIRTAPRDAMLSLATDQRALGTAFGVHRAMDTLGAMLGPVAAFGVLTAVAGGYDVVFVASAAIGAIGVAVLLLFTGRQPAAERRAPTVAPGGSLGARPAVDLATADAVAAPPASRGARARELAALVVDPRLRRILLAACVLALATIGDAFLYLKLQRTLDLPVRLFPLLAAGTAAAYLLAALPVGVLADRVGRRRVLLGGHGCLLAAYLTLLSPLPPTAMLVTCLALVGLYYAAADGVLAALTSAALPAGTRTTGLALVQTGVALGQFTASVAAGALWTAHGADTALAAVAGALAVALAVAAWALRQPRPGRTRAARRRRNRHGGAALPHIGGGSP
ncbi:MFS transporter [Frankia sp. CNm7]|uniref:MFS transporter n=1 Tax=Frankia nepalensis TaxID=1836974 RepID=A0A937RN63_9ACTN|nr:MFS transporter [Frankia nepalensis]MBL7501227.1 MFS transporter [Frankia nepalensis]MBL7512775.1 MFS transporter [Frankia nepalensis]MBL7521350.1 MFS transporter [Frankia nepalensis]MBL7629513.1 MFS transporter [Frankia nepalensis]